MGSSALLLVAAVAPSIAGTAGGMGGQSISAVPLPPSSAAAFSASGEYTPPRVNRSCPTPRPELSEAQQHRNQQGDVVVGVYVTAHGHPKKITVARSSGYDDLDNAAAAAAASWHYYPAMVGSARVSDWVAVKFHFAAQDPDKQTPPTDNSGPCNT